MLLLDDLYSLADVEFQKVGNCEPLSLTAENTQA